MLERTTQNFQQEVLESQSPTLVYFYSPVGCAPCKMPAPVVRISDHDWNGTIRGGKLNISQQAHHLKLLSSAVAGISSASEDSDRDRIAANQ